MNTWDRQAEEISQEIAALAHNHVSQAQMQNQHLMTLKAGVFTLQNTLASQLDRIDQCATKKDMLPQNSRALLHWAQVLAEHVRTFYQNKVEYLGYQMWIKLIRYRIAGNYYPSNFPITNDQIIELSVRQQKMLQTKYLLKNRLEQLARERDLLLRRHADFDTASSNQEASFSLNIAMEGRDFAGTLRGMFSKLSHIVSFKRHFSQNLLLQTAEFNAKAETIVNDCRDIIVEDLKRPLQVRAAKTLKHYEESLKKIYNLQQEIDQFSRRLTSQTPRTAPVLIKR